MRRLGEAGIWLFAFGYFAAYAPYSALTKAVSKGSLIEGAGAVDGLALLPATVFSSVVGMVLFLTGMKWWRYATQANVLGFSLPRPRWRTLLSGTCTAAIVVTTTLAYTFPGISIVFAMLLMRGGVLVIAPVVDAWSGRRVRWWSWTALVLSIASLVVAFAEKGGFALSLAATLDIGVYLAAYFVRLKLMSQSAKSDDEDANKRWFVEEQIVGTPLVMIVLAIVAFGFTGPVAEPIRWGFTEVWGSPILGAAIAIGLLSQGTGIFGGLILLDKRENTFCVPVNRASSILAGLVATLMLWAWLGERAPSLHELVGASLILAAILVLSIAPLVEKRRTR